MSPDILDRTLSVGTDLTSDLGHPSPHERLWERAGVHAGLAIDAATYDILTRLACRSRASHAVAAVEAAIARAAPDGQGTAVVAGRGVALEVGELLSRVLRSLRRGPCGMRDSVALMRLP